jgi:hypothetical protein
MLSLADFADGKPTNGKGNQGIFSMSLVARGEKDLHKEKSMNGVRYSLGLYANYPLANGILCGGAKRCVDEYRFDVLIVRLDVDYANVLSPFLKREAAFKKGGAKQMNHVRGTDGWTRTLFVSEVCGWCYAFVSIRGLCQSTHQVGYLVFPSYRIVHGTIICGHGFSCV